MNQLFIYTFTTGVNNLLNPFYYGGKHKTTIVKWGDNEFMSLSPVSMTRNRADVDHFRMLQAKEVQNQVTPNKTGDLKTDKKSGDMLQCSIHFVAHLAIVMHKRTRDPYGLEGSFHIVVEVPNDLNAENN